MQLQTFLLTLSVLSSSESPMISSDDLTEGVGVSKMNEKPKVTPLTYKSPPNKHKKKERNLPGLQTGRCRTRGIHGEQVEVLKEQEIRIKLNKHLIIIMFSNEL